MTQSGGVPTTARFLDGHFPGNPIVPGAVLLGLAAQGLGDQGLDIKRVQRMKFLRQLAPGQPFEIILEQGDPLSRLIWLSGAETLAEARVELRPRHG